MLLLALLGCSPLSARLDEAGCDPRTLAPGEVRARQIPCGDELVDGGEGRVGDWLLENAHARYVIRGTYAALTHLDEEGGTLIDAAVPGGEDLLLEYLPDGDRTTIEAVNGDGEARLDLPGLSYRLAADSDALFIEGATAGSLQGRPEVVRTGPTLADVDGFFGVAGVGAGSSGAVRMEGVTHVALSPESLWPDGASVREEVDADAVVVVAEGADLARFPVVDGVAEAWIPAGAGLAGEREGCVYDGLVQRGCGWLQLRVADDTGADLRAMLVDGHGTAIPVPAGGGRLPVGPDVRTFHIWAGPTHSVAELPLPGGDVERTVTLVREVADEDAVLAALAVEVAPDAGSGITPSRAATELAGEGVGFAVMLADDEVPGVSVDEHDNVVAVAGSRASGVVWSWPWSQNGKRPAHGAVPWEGLDALDLLAASEGGQSNARLTVVDGFWVERARIEADPHDWDPRPDAFWMSSVDALEIYLALLDDWIDVAPVGPRTWIEVDADRNLVAYEAGIVAGRTTAGNGPRLALALNGEVAEGWELDVRLLGPRWMGLRSVSLWTSAGEIVHPVEGAGHWKWAVPAGTTWVVAVAHGDSGRPWLDEAAWAVSAPLWIRRL